MAVGLRRLDDTPWARDARRALLKVVAAMPEGAAARARTLADGVRLLVHRPARRTRRSPTPWCMRSRRPRRSASTTSTSAAARPCARSSRTTSCSAQTARTSPAGAGSRGRARLPHRPHPLGRAAARRVPATRPRVRRRGLRDAHGGVGVKEVTETPTQGCRRTLHARRHDQRLHPQHARLVRGCNRRPRHRHVVLRRPVRLDVSPFGDPETTGIDYRVAALAGSDAPFGGVVATGGMPGHAVFYIAVTDVAATCEAAEQLGGKVASKDSSPRPGRRSPTSAIRRQPVRCLHAARVETVGVSDAASCMTS